MVPAPIIPGQVSRLISNNPDKNIKKTGFNLQRTPDQKVVRLCCGCLELDGQVLVALSHWPLLPKHDQLTDAVLGINPEVIFQQFCNFLGSCFNHHH